MRSVLCLFVLVFALSTTASAETVNTTFAGRIMVSEKRYPMSASSLAAFNAQVNKQSVSVFKEDKDKKYMIFFAGFLKAPLNDVEYMVKLYELQGKGQKLIASFEQFSDTRGQTSLLSKMQLEKKVVGTNKEILMVIENKGKVLASTRFKLIGEGEKFNGKVNFSEDEASGKKRLDDDDE
ncbi:MAG: hypothetical protein KF773_19785 [Deltaproteobacteria bacterium]|nr:hypothetical protein [Deltaproteobacteria bacterium]